MSEVLKWHFGPTANDPNPGSMWCDTCGHEVYIIEGSHCCGGCGLQDEPFPEEEPEQQRQSGGQP